MQRRRKRRRGVVVNQGLPLVVQFEFVTWVLLEWSEWFDRNVSCCFSKGEEFENQLVTLSLHYQLNKEFQIQAANSIVMTCRHPAGQPLPYSAVTVVYHLWPRALILSSNRDCSQIRWERERCRPDLVFVAEQKVWRCDGSRGWGGELRKPLLHKIRVGTVWHADGNPLLRAFAVMLLCSGPRFRTQKRIQECIAG